MYDPAVGRFAGKDPAGMVDGPNLYAYVGNSPVNLVDPSGQWAVAAPLAFAGPVGWIALAGIALFGVVWWYYSQNQGQTQTQTRKLTVDEFKNCGKPISHGPTFDAKYKARRIVGKDNRVYEVQYHPNEPGKGPHFVIYELVYRRAGDKWVKLKNPGGKNPDWDAGKFDLPKWWPC